MSFDLISQKLQRGDIINFNVLAKYSDDNTLMEFIDKQGNKYQAIVYHDKINNQISPPRVASVPQVLEKLKVSNIAPIIPSKIIKYPIDPDAFESSKLHHVQSMIDLDQRELFEQYKNLTALLWASGSTFRDLQALNLAFLQGFLLYAPYHFGPLDPESNIILEPLNAMNRLDMLTVNSQPYEEFPHYLTKIPIRQRPYIDFYYWNDKAPQLAQMLIQRKPSVVINTLRFSDGIQMLYGANKPLPLMKDRLPGSQDFKNGQWVEDYGTSMPIKVDNEGYLHRLEEFGPNFVTLIQQNLTFIMVVDINFDNTMIEEIVKIGKELL